MIATTELGKVDGYAGAIAETMGSKAPGRFNAILPFH